MPRPEPQRKKIKDQWYSNNDRQKSQSNNRKGIGFLGRLFGETLAKGILDKLEPVWNSGIQPALIEKFGGATTLYAIFYAGKGSDEMIMEVWDPKYIDVKSSEVFSLRGMPPEEIKYLPKERGQADCFSLQNWELYY
ncbi:MAG: hypothetical protein F6K41_31785 [Symploca sp. SIO3E6]|nr:hypothetical protein [Caldora sp. SIO3E6]